jgi:GNAT superfamily N-acetyltransferase
VTDAAGITVRPAVEADLAAVLALYAQPGMDDGRRLSLSDARRLLARFAAYPDYTLYVAELDGEIVGTFALLIMDNLGHLGAPSAIVEDVMVEPAAQGRGIGQAMMEFARQKGLEKRCYKLVLSSNAKRERAHKFYEQLGYERYGYCFRLDLERAAP